MVEILRPPQLLPDVVLAQGASLLYEVYEEATTRIYKTPDQF